MRVFADHQGLPIKSWAPEVEEGALEQAQNLSRLPFAFKHIALMPDTHKGYGMPIGGVLAAKGAVVPYAIGVDIGCGVRWGSTGLYATSGRIPAVLEDIKAQVPTGFETHQFNSLTSIERRKDILNRMGRHPDFGTKFENQLGNDQLLYDWFLHAVPQAGTLGGGNHFIEVQEDEVGEVFVMLHSGSRSLGKAICDFSHKAALTLNERWFSDLPHRELAYLPLKTDEFRMYWDRMQFALRWAEVNRDLMWEAVVRSFEKAFKYPHFDEAPIDVHHNYAAFENHFGENVIVHRKGAVRARAGETVLIPGSMGTASYTAMGSGNPMSFNTCQHGAGRAMSRKVAGRVQSGPSVIEELAAKGITVVTPTPGGVNEEAPYAYKDVEEVMHNSAALVTPIRRLTPMGVVKG